MAAVDDLIGELAAGGELEATGDFTLDREKARDKMRQFQLADPQRYVLLLVAAAAEKGAPRVDFRIDTDDVEVRFFGEPFSRDDFEELYVSMFVDRTDGSLRARQDLAVAVNAAMALTPRWIRITTAGEDKRGLQVTMSPGKDDAIEEREDLPPGTFIHIKERFRAGLFLRFVARLRGEIPEARVLESACRHSDRPIWLNGERVSSGMDLGKVWGLAQTKNEHVHAIAGYSPIGEMAQLVVLAHGVELATHPLEGFPRGFVAMADCSTLKRDVSQADVVRDDAYFAMLGALQEARDEALLGLCRDVGWQIAGVRYDEDEDDQHAGDGAVDEPEVQTQAIAHVDNTSVVRPWVARMLVAEIERRFRDRKGGDRDELTKALCAIRLWTTIAGEHLTTDELAGDKRRVAFTSRLVSRYDSDKHGRTVYAPTRGSRAALRRIFGKRVVDRTRTLVREAKQYKARQLWRSQPREPDLGEGMFVARAPIVSEIDGVRGEVGLRYGGGERASVVVIVDGCVLMEVSPNIAVPGFVAVVEAPLSPNAGFDGVHRDGTLGNVLADILCACKTAMERAAASVADKALDVKLQGLFCAYIWQIANEEFATQLFKAFGHKRRSIDHHLARHGGGKRRKWAPDWDPLGERPHPIAKLPLFPRLGAGPPASLVDVAKAYADNGSISWLGRHAHHVQTPYLVLAIGETRRATLTALFGDDALYEAKAEHRKWILKAKHMDKPSRVLSLAHRGACPPLFFDTEDGQGVVALNWLNPSGPRERDLPMKVEIRLASRLLSYASHRFRLPGVTAIVDDESLQVDWDDKKLAQAGERERVAGWVAKATARLLIAQIPPSQAAVQPGQVGVAQWILTLLFPNASWHTAFRTLVDERGPDKGTAAYVTLLGLRMRFTDGGLTSHLERAIAKGNINVGAIEREAESNLRDGESTPRSTVEPEVANRCAEHLGTLRSLALYEKVSGGMASLDDIWTKVDEGEPVRWLEVARAGTPLTPIDTEGALVLRLTEMELAGLEKVFGRRTFEEAETFLEALAKKRRFESRPQIETLTLTEEDALVKVPVDTRGFEGEVALRLRMPSSVPAVVFACRGRRSLGWVAPPLQIPLAAVLSSSSLGDATGGPLPQQDLRALADVCEHYVPALISKLVASYSSFSDDKRPFAEAWLRWLIVHRGRPAGRAGTQSIEELDALPGFPLADGSRATLDDLKQASRKHGRLRGIGSGDGHEPLTPDEPVLDLRDPDVRQEVEALFRSVEDHDALAQRERMVQRRRAQAEPLAKAPKDALVVERLQSGGLVGALWLQPSAGRSPSIALGGDDCTVVRWTPGVRSLEHVLPCSGAAQGSGVRVDDDFLNVELRSRARRALVRASENLYLELAETMRARIASGDDAAGDASAGAVPLSWLHAPLLPVALHLVREAASLDRDVRGVRRKLTRVLTGLPLLELASGRKISIETAQRERPRELWHLGLWDPEEVELEPVGEPEPEPDLTEELVEELTGEPEPEPPPEPTPQERLLEAIRGELRMVRANNRELLSDGHLDGLTIRSRDGNLACIPDAPATIDASHPVVARMLQQGGHADAVTISFLASAVYTALNIVFADVTDKDEALFLRLHAEHVATATQT